MALLAHLGMGLFPPQYEGRKVLAIGSKVKNGSEQFQMSPLALVSIQWTIHRLERLADGASAEDAFKTEAGRIQDGLTAGEWVRRHVAPRGAHRIECGCAVIFGADMNEVFFYISSCIARPVVGS